MYYMFCAAYVRKTLFCWQNLNSTTNLSDVVHLDIASYNVPKGEGTNLLGHIGYSDEEFYSELGKPNTAQPLFWAETSKHWLHLAANLEVWLTFKLLLLTFWIIFVIIMYFPVNRKIDQIGNLEICRWLWSLYC